MKRFTEINNESISGVAYKTITIKKAVIAYFSRYGNATIADLKTQLSLSTPKIIDVLNDLVEFGLVKDYGKQESSGGRKPNVYGLVNGAGYFLGVDIKNDHLKFAVLDLQKNLVSFKDKVPYEASNTEKGLNELCNIILGFIKESSLPKDKLLGIGISLFGRINQISGKSHNLFNFYNEPLEGVLSQKLDMRVFIENDSRAMCYGEFARGVVTTEKDMLFLNIDYGLGVGIIINGSLYYGKSGFSGEFGHVPAFDNEIMCRCGKKGCLETEVSGWALLNQFKQRIDKGSASILSDKYKEGNLEIDDILEAIYNDDVLAIELVAEMGGKLGRSMASLINIFNPELVVLGGKLTAAGENLLLPLKTALRKYSSSLVNNDTQIKITELNEQAGVWGACLLARNRVLEN
ncbi:ROK family protein [Pedobacter sp.]|uniref:ROK family protein n=1 Tax=Pedobacter sp. TaxID=1411316 RepID=UPI00396C3C6A